MQDKDSNTDSVAQSLLIVIIGGLFLIISISLKIWAVIPFILFLLSIPIIGFLIPDSEEKPNYIFRRKKWMTISVFINCVLSFLLGELILFAILFLIFVVFLVNLLDEI